ncbi:MAG: hypothetical protein MZU97_03515 [Bacillus subtilis]|nr:hypothetical protein [Bacillus subtilis]
MARWVREWRGCSSPNKDFKSPAFATSIRNRIGKSLSEVLNLSVLSLQNVTITPHIEHLLNQGTRRSRVARDRFVHERRVSQTAMDFGTRRRRDFDRRRNELSARQRTRIGETTRSNRQSMHGATVLGTGINPGMMMDLLVSSR